MQKKCNIIHVCAFLPFLGNAEPQNWFDPSVGSGCIQKYLVKIPFWESYFIFWHFILTFMLKNTRLSGGGEADSCFPIFCVGRKRANKDLFFKALLKHWRRVVMNSGQSQSSCRVFKISGGNRTNLWNMGKLNKCICDSYHAYSTLWSDIFGSSFHWGTIINGRNGVLQDFLLLCIGWKYFWLWPHILLKLWLGSLLEQLVLGYWYGDKLGEHLVEVMQFLLKKHLFHRVSTSYKLHFWSNNCKLYSLS